MRVSMTTGAGMLCRVSMHATDKRRRFIGVAGGALYGLRLVRMGIEVWQALQSRLPCTLE
jgi:CRISPR/Cas system endoribonuclease Cas6 (RAMP superfamily)